MNDCMDREELTADDFPPPDPEYDYDYYEEEQEEDVYYEPPEAPEPWHKTRPTLGTLSRGPVGSACPDIIYDDQWDRLPNLLTGLTLPEGEELVEFLCGLDQVCPVVADCEFLSRDSFRSALAQEAARRGDFEMARRHRDQMTDPREVDELIAEQQLKWQARHRPRRNKRVKLS